MIPENTLAVGPALRWLGLAMSVLFVLSVLFVYGGGALWRRLQRKAVQRSLDKVAKIVTAVLLSFSLLTPQAAYSQTPPTSIAARYQKLFTMVGGIMREVPKLCKSDACAKAAEEGTAIITDAQEKHSKGLLTGEALKQFHADLNANLLKVRAALIASLPEKDRNKIASRCPICKTQVQVKPVQTEECQLCDEVLHTTLEICLLYSMELCPTCVLICISTAALAYGHCLQDFCQVVGGDTN
jgi:hypothetical protein